MIEKTATTDIGSVTDIPIVYNAWESVEEFTAHCEGEGRDGGVTLLERLNAQQRQNAMQTPKGAAREVLDKFGPDSEEFATALEVYQGKTPLYKLSGARTVGDGIKQKESSAAARKLKGDTAHLDDADTITIGQLREMFGEEGVPIA